MIVWTIDATIAYTDDSWKSVSLINDDGGLRLIGGTMADLSVLAYDPTYKQFLAAMGRSAPAGGFPANVKDVVYRITCTLTNGYVHEFGSTDGLPTTSDDLAAVVSILNADPTFTAALNAIYPSGPVIPQMIITISGLPPGQIYLGLGNGIHTVNPTIYGLTPREYWGVYWISGSRYDSLAINISSWGYGTFSTDVDFMRGSTWLGFWIYSTVYSGGDTGVLSYNIPFTAGPVTTKIKNRAFGNLLTDAGVSISWQRGLNWPSNP
jgi:hypothetical protein